MSTDVRFPLASARTLAAKAEENSILLFIGFAAALPYAIQFLGLSLTFAVEIIVFLLAAYGVHLLYGYTGMLSFGHAAFFGGGAYVTTYVLVEYELTALPAVGIGVLATLVLAAVIGFFTIRQHGIYFAILTLAFGQILFFLAQQLEITGGSHGLIGPFDRPPVELGVFSYDLNNVVGLYGFVATVTVVVLYLLYRFLNSQLGSVFVAVRENEQRAGAIGYDVRQVKLLSFIISGAITGLAGSLYTIYLGLATPDLLNWALSGELLFIIILGGAHTLLGPVAGTVLYFSLEEGVRHFTDRWQFFVGLLFLLLVHFAPKGTLGSLRETGERLFNRD